jgi:hypothetical protein
MGLVMRSVIEETESRISKSETSKAKNSKFQTADSLVRFLGAEFLIV